MDAYLGNSQNSRNSFDPPPVLIAADSESGQARARRTIAIAGLRVADAVTIEGACARIDRQAAASALWIELEDDPGPATDSPLDHVAADVSNGRYSAVVAAPAAIVDRLSRHLFEADIEVILDASETTARRRSRSPYRGQPGPRACPMRRATRMRFGCVS